MDGVILLWGSRPGPGAGAGWAPSWGPCALDLGCGAGSPRKVLKRKSVLTKCLIKLFLCFNKTVSCVLIKRFWVLIKLRIGTKSIPKWKKNSFNKTQFGVLIKLNLFLELLKNYMVFVNSSLNYCFRRGQNTLTRHAEIMLQRCLPMSLEVGIRPMISNLCKREQSRDCFWLHKEIYCSRPSLARFEEHWNGRLHLYREQYK